MFTIQIPSQDKGQTALSQSSDSDYDMSSSPVAPEFSPISCTSALDISSNGYTSGQSRSTSDVV